MKNPFYQIETIYEKLHSFHQLFYFEYSDWKKYRRELSSHLRLRCGAPVSFHFTFSAFSKFDFLKHDLINQLKGN